MKRKRLLIITAEGPEGDEARRLIEKHLRDLLGPGIDPIEYGKQQLGLEEDPADWWKKED